MTHTAAFGIDDELRVLFDGQTAASPPEPRLGAIQVHIRDERFVLAGSSQLEGTEALNELLAGAAKTPCYVLLRTSGGWILGSYVPDEAPVREKMVYSSGRDAVRKQLGGTDTRIVQMHWTSLDEAARGVLAPSESAELDTAVMTATEVLAIEDAKATAVEAAGGKVSSAALKFPMTGGAAAALQAFHAGSSDALVLYINGETVDTHPCAQQQVGADALSGLLPTGSPSYLLYRWKHEREGEARAVELFVYCCPETSHVRAKMLHASTKAAALDHIAAAGVQVSKSFEVGSPDEVDEAFLVGEFYPACVEQKVITKAAPRGGRKLTKRRDG